MKFALIKELKNPPDKRVVMNPEVCQKALETLSGYGIDSGNF
jgi:hypothetical protein